MSVSGGSESDGRDKSAEALLRQLLTEREWLAVLEYSRASGMESDDAVFFMVALLKIFAHAYDRILAAIATAERGRDALETTVDHATLQLDRLFAERALVIRQTLDDASRQLAFRTAEMHAARGEMKILREQLETTVRDARKAFATYEQIRGDSSIASFSHLLDDRLLKAIDKRVPVYDELFRRQIFETLALGMGRYMLFVQGELVVLAIIAGLLGYYLS